MTGRTGGERWVGRDGVGSEGRGGAGWGGLVKAGGAGWGGQYRHHKRTEQFSVLVEKVFVAGGGRCQLFFRTLGCASELPMFRRPARLMISILRCKN